MRLDLKYSGLSIDLRSEAVADFPSTLVVALYDEAIASLAAAIAAIESGDVEARFEATTQAMDVVTELHHALDLEQGGEIARNLSGMYQFIIAHLPTVNLRNDAAVAQQAIELLMPVRDSWAELDQRIRYEVGNAEAMERTARSASRAREFPRLVAGGGR